MLFPWPGFFELLAVADIYVHLDDAQFSSGSFTNRIQVKHPAGWKWMTIPVRKLGLDQRICDLAAASSSWRRAHRDMLRQSLATAPHLDDALSLLDRVYEQQKIVDLLIDSIEKPAEYLAIWKALAMRSSALGVPGKGSRRVLDIVLAVGGTRYVTAHGARDYLDHAAFESAGVAVEYIVYSKTPYRQLYGDFLPYVTALDLIAALGPAAATVVRPATVSWRELLVKTPA